MLLAENNPLILAKLLKTGGLKSVPTATKDKKRPGLSFRRGDWLIMVGRDASENDALLRRHVKGNDLWLHVRDFPGSYVFIKQRSGKSFPLEILLDAGNLAVFYSKGRNNGKGDLFYTPVKYLRRAKNGPKGLVIPTQEKNLHITLDEKRLKELESCRIEK
jgi:predicted ribosome quality control (RQC) complex YloA/Tae2 family protein